MIKQKFEELAKQMGWRYEYTEKRQVSWTSRNIPICLHKIYVEHNSVDIELVYEFGYNDLAEIKSSIRTTKKTANFSMKTKTQIQRLFSKNQQSFQLKSKDPNFKSYLVHVLESSVYSELVRKTTFEPVMKGTLEGDTYILRTDFYLGFAEKELSILPSINVHKKIIDKLLSS